MQLQADRNFPGWELWGLAPGTALTWPWRISEELVFTPLQVLADGSFLSVMPTPAENVRLGQARRRPGAARPVREPRRITEYRSPSAPLTAPPASSYTTWSTLLDHQPAPAAELATLYHERWESENSYAELKTRHRGAAFILRSRSPELVRQELIAFLTVYQAHAPWKPKPPGRPASTPTGSPAP